MDLHSETANEQKRLEYLRGILQKLEKCQGYWEKVASAVVDSNKYKIGAFLKENKELGRDVEQIMITELNDDPGLNNGNYLWMLKLTYKLYEEINRILGKADSDEITNIDADAKIKSLYRRTKMLRVKELRKIKTRPVPESAHGMTLELLKALNKEISRITEEIEREQNKLEKLENRRKKASLTKKRKPKTPEKLHPKGMELEDLRALVLKKYQWYMRYMNDEQEFPSFTEDSIKNAEKKYTLVDMNKEMDFLLKHKSRKDFEEEA
ncbi:MAG: hypothetical protein ABIG20_04640 [archaeon]